MATMKMVMKDGKSVPAFAADGKGKMAKGGKVVSKKMAGGMVKKSMPKKAMGGKISKKSY